MVAPIIIPSLQKNPIEAWQRAGIMEQRPRTDWAEQLNKRMDEDFPVSEKTVLVMDNLIAMQ
jgi:hypothetical protein